MPATAGRVKMPANNRVSTSSTLNTHAVWKDVIKYDPYAAEGGGEAVRCVRVCVGGEVGGGGVWAGRA
jgi:hypothetical protein